MGQDLNDGTCEAVFAATLPLEVLVMVLSNAATGERDTQIFIADVSRAYIHADCRVDMYVRLCGEDIECEEAKQRCGKLVDAMYGTRPAAFAWKQGYRNTLVGAGFRVCTASPCIFHMDSRNLWVLGHGDDSVAAEAPSAIAWFRALLQGWYDNTSNVLVRRGNCNIEGKLLNRIIKLLAVPASQPTTQNNSEHQRPPTPANP